MTASDLKTVRKALWEARQEWFKIGRELHLSMSDLDAIKASYNSIELCFTEMLHLWLKQVDPHPTWSALIDALRSPTVKNEELAEHVKSVQEGEFIG